MPCHRSCTEDSKNPRQIHARPKKARFVMGVRHVKVNGTSVSCSVSLKLGRSPFTKHSSSKFRVVALSHKLETTPPKSACFPVKGPLFTPDRHLKLFSCLRFGRIPSRKQRETKTHGKCFDMFRVESTHRFGGRHLTNLCEESFCSLDEAAQCDGVMASYVRRERAQPKRTAQK